jgi:hypothetical protein
MVMEQLDIHLYSKNKAGARCQWLTPVIRATWEVEIRRIVVQDWEDSFSPSLKSPEQNGLEVWLK